ncbi:hypothetical protein AOLI_G00136100 [Acnodon oligacanthus]
MEWKVPGRKPDSLARSESGCQMPPMVCHLLPGLSGSQEGSMGLLPWPPAMLHELLGSRNPDLALLPREHGRRKPELALKGNMPKDECRRLSWVYSDQGRCSTQEEGTCGRGCPTGRARDSQAMPITCVHRLGGPVNPGVVLLQPREP